MDKLDPQVVQHIVKSIFKFDTGFGRKENVKTSFERVEILFMIEVNFKLQRWSGSIVSVAKHYLGNFN